jgi:hypothetical protein
MRSKSRSALLLVLTYLKRNWKMMMMTHQKSKPPNLPSFLPSSQPQSSSKKLTTLRRKKENKARKSERKRKAIQVAVHDELQTIFAAVSDWALGTKTNDAAVLK